MQTLIELYPLFRALWVVWFLLLFVAMLGWVMRPSAKDRYQAMSRLPFNDDPQSPRR